MGGGEQEEGINKDEIESKKLENRTKQFINIFQNMFFERQTCIWEI